MLRYIYLLLTEALGRPPIDPNNDINYTKEDIMNQICGDVKINELGKETPNGNPECLISKIPFSKIEPGFVEKTASFDDWVKSLDTLEADEYKLEEYVGEERMKGE